MRASDRSHLAAGAEDDDVAGQCASSTRERTASGGRGVLELRFVARRERRRSAQPTRASAICELALEHAARGVDRRARAVAQRGEVGAW